MEKQGFYMKNTRIHNKVVPGLLAMFMAAALGSKLWAQGYTAPAPDPGRALSFQNTHTGESADIRYWENGHYLPPALDAINHILRDHRRNEEREMSRATVDLLHDIRKELERRYPGQPIVFQIISGYRAPATNNALRRRGGGQAKDSRHMHGDAIDIRVSGIDLRELRDIAWCLKRGGVGYYPSDDFVHVDVHKVRFWGWKPGRDTCRKPPGVS